MSTITVKAPSSKSLSHRALIAAALAPGASLVEDILQSRDIMATMSCLSACGAGFDEHGDRVTVKGLEKGPVGGSSEKGESPADLFVSESGTTCRLLTAVAASGRGRFRIHGEGRMHERPIGRLTNSLANLGVSYVWEGAEGYPPFTLVTRGLSGGETTIDLEESSQYLSGLLLAAPLADGPVVISVSGDKAVSWPYVALTLKVMEDFKVRFKVESYNGHWVEKPWRAMKTVEPGRVRFVVEPSGYQPSSYRVEADWSGASYLLAAGALGPSAVHVANARADSLQGDRAILDILAAMGAKVKTDPYGVTVSPAPLRGVDVDMGRCPDLVPTVAVVAALAQGETRIRNVAHLRIKESDRLAAVAQELGKVGIFVEVLDDGLVISPGPVATGAVELSSHNDHRMAMCLTLLSLHGVRPALDNKKCVAKSFPDYFDTMKPILDAAGAPVPGPAERSGGGQS